MSLPSGRQKADLPISGSLAEDVVLKSGRSGPANKQATTRTRSSWDAGTKPIFLKALCRLLHRQPQPKLPACILVSVGKNSSFCALGPNADISLDVMHLLKHAEVGSCPFPLFSSVGLLIPFRSLFAILFGLSTTLIDDAALDCARGRGADWTYIGLAVQRD
jgi:hypothetical protein